MNRNIENELADKSELAALLTEWAFHKSQEVSHNETRLLVKGRIDALMARNAGWLNAEQKFEIENYRISLVSNPPRLTRADGAEVSSTQREQLAVALPDAYTRKDLNTKAILAGLNSDRMLRHTLTSERLMLTQGTRYDIREIS